MGELGEKAPDNDYALRPSFEAPIPNELTDFLKKLISLRKNSDALCNGGYKNIVITNHQLIFERKSDSERVLVAINASDADFTANHGDFNGTCTDLLTGKAHTLSGSVELPKYSVMFLKMD